MPTIAVELLIVILLIIVNGVFALSELAVVSARKARLQELAKAGHRNARAALELANEPNRFLSTIQIGITLVGIFIGAFSGATISGALAAQIRQAPALGPYSEALALGIVVLGITYLSLILGELVPKRLALSNPERIASAVAIPMRALSALASPIVGVLAASTELVLRGLRVRPSTEAPVTEEEVKILIEQGAQAGVFEAAEHDIVKSVFRLGDRRVNSLMTPRPEIVWLNLDDSPDDVRRVIVNCEHSRFPVCRGGLDAVVGVALAKSILAHNLADGPLKLEAMIQPALFVPETIPAFRALEMFKQYGAQMALVIDEYSALQGLVTVTDMLEALVGDMPSPAELAEAPGPQRADGSWLLDGMLPIEEVKEALKIHELPSHHYHSLGGFVMQQVGRIPSAGDHFEWQRLRFEVVKMDGNRVHKVLVTPTGPDRSDGPAGSEI